MPLSQNFYEVAKELFADYPKKVHALLPLLHIAQKESGALNEATMTEIAKLVEVPLTHVQGVVTFYTMFSLEKRGKNYIGVCTNLSCWLKGAKEFYQSAAKMLDDPSLKLQKSEFHLEETECLGACDHAPIVLCGEEYIENATLQDLKDWCAKKLATEDQLKQ